MKLLLFPLACLLLAAAFCAPLSAQTFAQGSDKTAAQLENLTKKIDEQNAKIDLLSQQILKLEQQVSTLRPGIMIGQATPAPSLPASASSSPPAGNAHIVAKGETLTSIAKAHKVGVQELQKFNQIENDRALQIGQTIMIPSSGTPATPSPTPISPNQ